jgi:hypothetical protein
MPNMRRCASLEEQAAVEAVTLLESLATKDLIVALARLIDDVVVCPCGSLQDSVDMMKYATTSGAVRFIQGPMSQ